MDARTCPTCGAPIAGGGLCPSCLLRGGLSAETLQREALHECTKCRSPLGDGARFCAHCGAAATTVTTEGDPIRAALEAKLRGQYRIIRLLGRGGMGAVYLARDLTLEREVAVKVIRTSSSSLDMHERFRREARTAARLSHPNIVPLHTFGEVEGMPYFVMGYVRGESLAAKLQRDGKMSEEEGLRVIAEVADALDHAHRQGVIHRDIKPDNVLIEDESGRALLTDFGVAKALGRGETMTVSGGVVGTPQYMSPEQAAGHSDIDARTDIYSLGVMAYAILTGRLPFEGTTAELLSKHLTQEPPSLRSLNAGLSQSTAAAIERCLAKDPSKRWPDARSLRAALGAGEESHLPDALHAVEARGIPGLAVAFAVIGGEWALGQAYGWWDDGGRIFLAIGAVGVSMMYVFVLARMRAQGFTAAQAQAAIWREPAWWLWWYPRAWRRRGNVWDRLPREVRIIRWVLPALFLGMPPVLIGSAFYLDLTKGGANLTTSGPAIVVVILPIAAICVAWVTADRRVRRRLRQQGIEGEDLNRIINSIPPGRVSFWSRPHIAAVLAPSPDERRVRGDSPHEHLQSILRHSEHLSGPLRPLGAEAAAAARLLIASIEDADREIAELAASVEGGQQERLTIKISALGDDAGPLRSFLEKELDLVRGLSERIEEATALRSRRMEMLRSLAVHIAALRAPSIASAETSSMTDRVRALCDDIAAHAVAQRA